MNKVVIVAAVLVAAAVLVYVSQKSAEPQPVAEVMLEEQVLAAVGEEVSYFQNTTGYLSRPAEPGVYPGVVMIHENRGLRPEIKAAADELAAEGYLVLAVDLYNGTVMETQDEARAFSATYDGSQNIENMKAAATYLRQQGAGKVASLGWCFGGAQSLALATSDAELDATVIYYGRLTEDRAALESINAPVLGIFGDQDQVIATSSVASFEAALTELGVQNEVHMYEGVGHAFANPSNPNFAPTETADAWSKTLVFLERTLR